MTSSDQTKNRGPATLKTAAPFVIATVALAVFVNPVIATALVGRLRAIGKCLFELHPDAILLHGDVTDLVDLDAHGQVFSIEGVKSLVA